MTKTCTKCGETKPLAEFHRHAECQYGRAAICKDCRNGHYREFRAEHKDRYAAHQRRYRAEGRNAKQRKVYSAVAKALRNGELRKPETCQHCGLDGRIEAHHRDYDLPLEVEWLCPLCHAKADQRDARARRAYQQAQLEFWSTREKAA